MTPTLQEDIRELNRTVGLCGVCKRGVDARIVEQDGKVYMHKVCPDHGERLVLIASEAAWYHRVMSTPAILNPPRFVKNDVNYGCPFDCGACSAHEQSVYLPVIPITSACNLDCPICYTINKNEDAYFIALEEFGAMLEVIRRNDPEMKIINLTGGEPTLHPELTDIIRLCHKAGIHRITISTHGLTFIRNEKLLRELADLRARMVLSFDSFDDKTNKQMLGARAYSAKMKVLDQFEKYNIDTTLIPVIGTGVNDHEIGRLIQLVLDRTHLRSLEIHSMTFTGQGGTSFYTGARITTPDILRRIEEATAGKIGMSDFVPSPCAHPLCYQTCYLLDVGDSEFIPFTRFMSADKLRELLTGNLYIEPGDKMERVLKDVITELWASELPDSTTEAVLRKMKEVIQQLFPSSPISYMDQQFIAERAAKTIYIHSHMDEENFDTDRIRQCCVGVPSADGGNIPTCSYNILYRGRDERFSKVPMAPLSTLPGGRKLKVLQ